MAASDTGTAQQQVSGGESGCGLQRLCARGVTARAGWAAASRGQRERRVRSGGLRWLLVDVGGVRSAVPVGRGAVPVAARLSPTSDCTFALKTRSRCLIPRWKVALRVLWDLLDIFIHSHSVRASTMALGCFPCRGMTQQEQHWLGAAGKYCSWSTSSLLRITGLSIEMQKLVYVQKD